jgi:bacterioferritin
MGKRGGVNKMSRVRKVGEVYRCEICGNVVEVKEVGGGELVCCGQPMKSVGNPDWERREVKMGTKGKGIVKMDVGKLVELLNKALADEWLAYYQYWVGAKVVKGPMKEAAITELTEHAADELRHAGERCAIEVYSGLLEKTKDKDPITYNMVLQILQDEVEHEEDFQALLEDIEDMMKRRW